MKAAQSLRHMGIMSDNASQPDSNLLSTDNILLLEEILRNFLVSTAPVIPEQPLLTQLLPTFMTLPECKVPEQPLDLSMKAEVPQSEDFGYGSGSERLMSLPDLSLEEPLLDQSMDYDEYAPESRGMRNSPMLWQFLLSCLDNEEFNPSVVEWICKEQGVFRLTNARVLAQLWGEKKNKPNMSEDNLKRSLRYYYGKKILTKVQGQRDVYRFYLNLP
nr:ETS transcription factor Elf 2 [Hymenolepis microstoma]